VRTLVGGRVRAAIAEAAPDIERSGVTSWDFGVLPAVIENEHNGHIVRGFPAVIDDGNSVSIRVFSKPQIQERIMPSGIRRLLVLAVPVARKVLEREASNQTRLALAATRIALADLLDDCVMAAAAALVDDIGVVRDAESFAALVAQGRTRLALDAAAAVRTAGLVVVTAAAVHAQMDRLVAPSLQPSVADARRQLDRLVRPGFVIAAGAGRLADVVRYVQGIQRRLEKLPEDPGRDLQRIREAVAIEQRYAAFVATLAPSQVTRSVVDTGWMLEELRISLFAQTLGTSGPVSAKRIDREMQRLAQALD
jgi:ATP-dependent helicase HrpA